MTDLVIVLESAGSPAKPCAAAGMEQIHWEARRVVLWQRGLNHFKSQLWVEN